MRYLALVLLLLVSGVLSAQKIANKKDVEVTIETDEGTLYGSLLVPKGKKPKKVVLLIPGSGPTDRDCNSAIGMETNAFLLLAEALYEEGIATLRVDKRASGKSKATFATSLMEIQFDDFIRDTELWIEFLKKDKRFSEITIAGHSQGSLAAMVAGKNKRVDKYISIAGAGEPIDEVLMDQLGTSLPDQRVEIRYFLDSLSAGVYWHDGPSAVKNMLPEYLTPFMQQWISYDPHLIIQELICPVLIVNGETDLQVAVKEAELLYETKLDAEYVIIPEMNHVLKNAPSERFANFATYNAPDLPLNEKLIETIITFVLK